MEYLPSNAPILLGNTLTAVIKSIKERVRHTPTPKPPQPVPAHSSTSNLTQFFVLSEPIICTNIHTPSDSPILCPCPQDNVNDVIPPLTFPDQQQCLHRGILEDSSFKIGCEVEFKDGGTWATILSAEPLNDSDTTFVVMTTFPPDLAGLKVRLTSQDIKPSQTSDMQPAPPFCVGAFFDRVKTEAPLRVTHPAQIKRDHNPIAMDTTQANITSFFRRGETF